MKRKSRQKLVSGIISLALLILIPINAWAFPAFVNDIPEPVNGNTHEFAEDAPWYSRAVYTLWYAHIVDEAEIDDETGSVLYGPGRGITREQFLAFLGRFAEEWGEDISIGPADRETAHDSFTDWALDNHILCGRGESPAEKELLSRQEMAVFLIRFADHMGIEMEEPTTAYDYDRFTDSDHVSLWAEEGIKKACRFKLIAGEKNREGGYSLNPRRTATRAEAAQMIYNYAKAAHIHLPFYAGDVADS